jgi:trimeric autotransporter adhesin
VHARELNRLTGILIALVACLFLRGEARGQCEPVWRAFDPSTASFPGINGAVNASVMWDPDGSGPQSTKLVFGGTFTVAGDALASRIATVDLATGVWAPVGTGISGGGGSAVNALETLPNGDLVAGGSFTIAGGVAANRIARWDGSTWSPLGTGISGSVLALKTRPNGDLIVGGVFTTAGGITSNNIARWDGSTWAPLGTGMTGGSLVSVRALATLPNGDLVAGGFFSAAGGVSANSIARWNGTSWSAMGLGVNGTVMALTVLPNGDLIVGGQFSSAGGVTASNIARVNGTTGAWSSLGTGFSNDVLALTTLANGDVIAGGRFISAGSINARYIARWSASSGGWSAVSGGTDASVFTLVVLPDGNVVAGGAFSAAGSIMASCIARWTGSTWAAFKPGMNRSVSAILTLANGEVVAGGSFGSAGSVNARRVARWTGTTWAPLGAGITSDGVTFVSALAVLGNGNLVAGGNFMTAGGVLSNRLARWNGSAWSPLGVGGFASPFDADVNAMIVRPNGDLVAGGSFRFAEGISANRVARWNGANWVPLGTGVSGGNATAVLALATLANGDLVVGGRFRSAGGNAANGIARWDGSIWSSIGSGSAIGAENWVHALAVLPNGDIVAGGRFTSAGEVPALNIARWDGSNWLAMGSGVNGDVDALAVLADGNVIAGGLFTAAGGVPAASIARWNGIAWSPLGAGIDGSVFALAMSAEGDLVVGGDFTTAGGAVAPFIARWGCLTPTCDSIDFNNNGSLFDPEDVDAFLSVFSEGPCIPATATCNDIDFNNDGALFDPCDIDSFLLVFSEGPCTLCAQ